MPPLDSSSIAFLTEYKRLVAQLADARRGNKVDLQKLYTRVIGSPPDPHLTRVSQHNRIYDALRRMIPDRGSTDVPTPELLSVIMRAH